MAPDRRTLGLLGAVLIALLWPAAAVAQCVPTAKTHQRWDVKTRATPASVTTQATTVAEMIAQDIPTVAGLPDTEIPNSDE